MQKIWTIVATTVFLMVCLTSGPAQCLPKSDAPKASYQETENTFRKLAPTLRYFDIHNALYDRFQSYGKPAYSGEPPEQGAVFSEIDSPRHSTASLLRLLKNNNAKVRTLALAALYAREDPQLLPNIVDLVDDQTKTYPEPMAVAMAMPSNALPPLQEKTVGQIADSIVRFYLEAAGFHYGVKGVPGREPGFAQYWQEHKDLKYCASWFAIKLRRASTGCSPTDKSRAANISSVRAQLDKLPALDRDWILLWLQSENGFDLFASEQDVVAALKQIGPDKLLKMLQRKLPSSDPDLRSRRSNDYLYNTLMMSALKRAKTVLRPDQKAAIMACDHWERQHQEHHISDPLITPWFAIAASQLDPEHAQQILHGEFARLDEDFYGFKKADLAASLWQAGGLKESAFLLDCFYDRSSLTINKQYSQFRPLWLKSIERSPRDREQLLKDLISDQRFDKLDDCLALQALIEVTSKLAGKPTADPQHADQAWHPLGVERCCCDIEAAGKVHPKETKDLLAVLAKWRRELRVSVSTWPSNRS